MEVLSSFMGDCKQGVLYICGPPGTGKSATVTQYTQTLDTKCWQVVLVNCVSLKRPEDIYATVLSRMDTTSAPANAATARSTLQARMKQQSNAALLLVLDEMDYLCSSSLETLYALFELADGVRIKVIGIANALNLTDTVLPHLQATGIMPKVLRFKPYTPTEITRILTARVQASSATSQSMVDLPALLLLGRKVANATGDIRKALDILRRAVELVEAEHRDALSTLDPNAPASGQTLAKVTIKHVAQAATQALSAGMATADQLRKLSLHELACLCTMAACKTTSIAATYEAYVRLCKRDKMTTPLVRTEFTSVCEALVDRGMLAIPRQGGRATTGARRMQRTSSQQKYAEERGIVLAVSEMDVLTAVGELGVLKRFFE
jgi:cell division control protein 6